MGKDYTGVMLEKIYDETKAVHELVTGQSTRLEFNRLERKVDKLSSDMVAVKKAVTVPNHDVTEHKRMPVDVAHGSEHVRRSRWAAA